MSRRLLAAMSLIASAIGPLHAAERDLHFRVLLDDDEIGEHRFRVNERGDQREIAIDAKFRVTFLGITFYTYEHTNRESWKDGCLHAIESRTDDNGERFEVAGRKAATGFAVSNRGEMRSIDDACVMSFAYWDPAFLERSRLLNSQTGEYLPVSIAFEADEVLQLGSRTVDARRYRVRNERQALDIAVWYERDSGRWVSLESRVSGGRVLRYVPMDTVGGG